MTDNALDSRAAFEDAIRHKAATDPAFRSQLKDQPAQALKSAFGLDLPAGFNIRVVTEAAGEMVLVLPSPSGELNDNELDVVSGGFSFQDLLNRIGPTAPPLIGKISSGIL